MTNKNIFIYNQLLKMLDTAESIIKKGQAYVEEGKATEAELMEARLIADMMPFVKQIQIISDNVKGAISRMASVENPKMEDTESTFAQLLERIEKTRAFVKTIDADAISTDVDSMTVKLPWMPEGMSWTGKQYFDGFVLQNAYFHVVTAYDILRMKGVQLGKMDFIGNI